MKWFFFVGQNLRVQMCHITVLRPKHAWKLKSCEIKTKMQTHTHNKMCWIILLFFFLTQHFSITLLHCCIKCHHPFWVRNKNILILKHTRTVSSPFCPKRDDNANKAREKIIPSHSFKWQGMCDSDDHVFNLLDALCPSTGFFFVYVWACAQVDVSSHTHTERNLPYLV